MRYEQKTKFRWFFLDFTDTILDKISCKKIWKTALLNCHFFLIWEVKKWIFFGKQDWSLLQTDIPPPPHHSILGVVRWRGTQSHVSTLSRGSGGWFYRKVLIFLQLFCPRLYHGSESGRFFKPFLVFNFKTLHPILIKFSEFVDIYMIHLVKKYF